jgi:hypothetical protein
VWDERGGVLGPDGFYHLSIKSPRRSDEEIPSKRRSQYRQRYAAMDAIEQQIHNCVGAHQLRSSTDTRASASANCISQDKAMNAPLQPKQKPLTLLPLDR